MTVLAIRSSSRINGVSKLHGRVADADVETPVPGRRAPTRSASDRSPTAFHVPTWMGPEMGRCSAATSGVDFEQRLLDPGFADEVLAIPDADIWDAHTAQKSRLLTLARERVLSAIRN